MTYILAGQSNALSLAQSNFWERLGVELVAEGGTSLRQTAGNDWSPSSEGELFDQLCATIDSIDSFSGIIWVQGEADRAFDGYGADVFVFSYGNDRVMDYQPGDVIDARGHDYTLTRMGENIRIDWEDAGTMTVLDTNELEFL